MLTHKFRPPGVPAHAFVSRRLNDLFSAALERHRHVATVAAAGSGKTVQWQLYAATSGGPVMWLGLDAADASPARLLSSLATALQTTVPAVGDIVQAALRDGLSDHEAAAILAEAVPDTPALLVLDACEAVFDTEPAVAPLVTFLEYTPPGLRVALLTREALPSPLRRRLLEDTLGIISEADLRLTVGEVLDWVAKSEASADAGELHDATGGWMAGVALGLRLGRANVSRDLSAWLVSEVLDRLPEEEQHFLQETALAEVVTAELAVALCGPEASRQWEDLRRRNLPAVTVGETTIQYHSILRSVLQSQLATRCPRRIPGLRARYARHLARTGDFEAATEVLLALGKLDDAAEAAEEALGPLYARADWGVIMRWLKALGEERTRLRPALVGAEIRALYGSRQFDEVQARVGRLDSKGQLRAATETDPALLATVGLALLTDPPVARRLLDRYQGDYRADAIRYLLDVGTSSDPIAPPPASEWGDMERAVTWGLTVQGRLKEVSACLSSDPTVPVTNLNPLLATLMRGDAAEALAQWQRVPLEIRDRPHSLFVEGSIELVGGDAESALAAYQAAVIESRRTGFFLDDLYELVAAYVMLSLGQVEDAVTLLEDRTRALAGDGELATLEIGQTFLGMGYLLQDQVGDAQAILQESLRSMRRAKRRLFLPTAAATLSVAESRLGHDAPARELSDLAYRTSALMDGFFALMATIRLFPELVDRELARDSEDPRWRRLAATLQANQRTIDGNDGGHTPKTTLDISTFGRDRDLWVDGRPAGIGRIRVVELAAYLALHPEGIDRAVLQEQLLPDADQRRGGNHFRQITHKLREATGISPARRGSRVAWPDEVIVDASDLRFERLVADGRGTIGDDRFTALHEALTLFTGPYLASSNLAWAEQRRYHLDLLWEEAVLEFSALAVARSEMALARERCEELLATNPYSEPAYRLLLRVEQAVGTDSSRLALYRRAVDALKELGLEPDPELKELLQPASTLNRGSPGSTA